MKNKVYKIINIVNIISIILVLTITPLYLGSYKDSYLNNYLLAFIFADLIGVIQYILKPRKLEKKFIIYILFIITYLLPLFSKDIVFFETHIKIFIMIILCFLMAINIWNVFKEKEDNLNKIIIFSSVITTIVSLLYIFMPTTIKMLGMQADYGDFYLSSIYRLYGTLIYPNSLALFCLVGIILTFKYKEKKLYQILLYINILGLFLTISKSIVLFTLIIFVIFALIDKQKRKILCSLIIPIMYNLNFYRRCAINNNLFKLIVITIILIVIYLFFIKLYEKQNKKFCIINIIILVIFTIFPYKAFYSESGGDDLFILDFMGLKNQDYEISMDIIGDNLDGNIYLYKQFLQNNSMSYLLIKQTKFAKNVKIKFKASNKNEYYSMKISNTGGNVKIDNVVITDGKKSKKVPIDYRLWPYNYVKSIEQLQYDISSVGGRFQIYHLCIDIIKENPFLGHGYDYFKIASNKNDNLYHVLVEHSQIMSLGVQNGIFSVILWIILLIMTLINSIRILSKDNIYKVMVILVIICSSFFDFSMSYHFFLLIFFTYSMLALNNKQTDIMFISSSGGHYAALKKIINHLNIYNYKIVVEGKKENAKFMLTGSRKNLLKYFLIIPINIFLSIIYFIHDNPKIILSTGAHTGVFMCFLGKLFKRKIIYVEVFDRYDDISLSGKLIYKIADNFIVQHEKLQKKYPKSIYIGGMY